MTIGLMWAPLSLPSGESAIDRAGQAEQEAGHQAPHRRVGQQREHRTARAEIDDDDRQADCEQERRAGGLRPE